jgi:hypothetical protein
MAANQRNGSQRRSAMGMTSGGRVGADVASYAATASAPLIAAARKSESGRCLIRVRTLRRKHREHDQRRADGLGSVTGADAFAVWICCCAVIGCVRGLHESPHHEFWQCVGRQVCDRDHTAKALCTRCFDPLAAGECKVWVCDAKAMVNTGQLASVMMR